MTKNLSIALFNFAQTFEYYPNYPDNIDFDQNKYAKELEKCIEDNFDYTIEKYGTVPPIYTGRQDIILD
ncbi:MAG: hypothetical protein LUG46_05765 [Erysipelotrichaceae bacterium]|nr:hypothetical protein [Erysipelotrichaceae bacterium]